MYSQDIFVGAVCNGGIGTAHVDHTHNGGGEGFPMGLGCSNEAQISHAVDEYENGGDLDRVGHVQSTGCVREALWACVLRGYVHWVPHHRLTG
jgi:hypothetical protein